MQTKQTMKKLFFVTIFLILLIPLTLNSFSQNVLWGDPSGVQDVLIAGKSISYVDAFSQKIIYNNDSCWILYEPFHGTRGYMEKRDLCLYRLKNNVWNVTKLFTTFAKEGYFIEFSKFSVKSGGSLFYKILKNNWIFISTSAQISEETDYNFYLYSVLLEPNGNNFICHYYKLPEINYLRITNDLELNNGEYRFITNRKNKGYISLRFDENNKFIFENHINQ